MTRVEKNRDLILNGSLYKAFVVLGLPVMLGSVIETLYNLGDTYWVSKLGHVEMGAIGLIWPIVFLMMSIGIGISIGGVAIISQHIGAGNMELARKYSGQLTFLMLTFSTVVGLVGGLFASNLVAILRPDPVMADVATRYIRIILFGMPTMFIFFIYQSIKRAQGITLAPTLYSAYGSVLNLILDPIFILTLGWGVEGAALATVLSRAIFASVAFSKLFKKDDPMHLHLKDLIPDRKAILEMIKVGIPNSVGSSGEAIGFAILNGYVVSFGTITMAAFTLGNRINSLVLMPVMGFGSALSTIIGQNIGADNIARAKDAIKKSVVINILLMAIGGLSLNAVAPIVVRQFSQDPVVIEQGISYLRIIGWTLPLMGIFQVIMSVFQGSGHSFTAMAISVGRLWAFRIPLIIIFKTYTEFGYLGVWYAMVLSNGLTCVMGGILYALGYWQKKIIKSPIDHSLSPSLSKSAISKKATA